MNGFLNSWWTCLGTLLALAMNVASGLGEEPLSKWGLAWPELTRQGDVASQLVAAADEFLLRRIELATAERAKHWSRDFNSPQAAWESVQPNRQRLAQVLGLPSERPTCRELLWDATTSRSDIVAEHATYVVRRVRWEAMGQVQGEGLLLQPRGDIRGWVVAIPDADQSPEQICGLLPGVEPASQFARRLVENGCLVVAPTLISRQRGQFQWLRQHDLSNREFLYRSAFELGRHIIGYELAKVLAAVDWLESQAARPGVAARIGVCGYGEGGMLALYAAALDRRIEAAVVSGYFADRSRMWREPIDRNVFGLLQQFGDAELAAMIAPRTLIVDDAVHPQFEYPPGGRGAPAMLWTPPAEEVSAEVRRAAALLEHWPEAADWIQLRGAQETGQYFGPEVLEAFLRALVPWSESSKWVADRQPPDNLQADFDLDQRMERMVRAIDFENQALLRRSHVARDEFMKDLDASSPDAYARSSDRYREYFRQEVIGSFDLPLEPPSPRARKFLESPKVIGYEIELDVFPGLFAYGVLLLPLDLKVGEKRPVVVCQHGLEGRPQMLVGEEGFDAYQAFAMRLAERGFITFAPQNLYIFQDRFRTLQRKAYPLKKTLFSLITPQHQQIVDWLQSLPMVDPDRVAFYGLSYGGKTAMRVPALVTDYCLSICSADFNEWVDKNASTLNPRSYVWTGEYEIFEWNLGGTFNYAEMAALIAPRPFMVERGHADGVADDWTVGWEFARVRHLYAARLKIPENCQIEWFDGPHRINGVGTFEFLHRHLQWPQP